MSKTFENTKLFARLRDENFSIYEYYARANGMHSKSMLILMWIYYSSNGVTQQTICKKTYSTKQVVSATIKTFLQKNYIYFEDSLLDKRFKKIKLTAEGHKFASTFLNKLEFAEIEAMKGLNKEEQAKFIEWMSIFNKRFKENIEKIMIEKESE